MNGLNQQVLADTLAQLNAVILGKEQQIRLALSCLLAEGHLLIEDLPGMGKTTLAQALSAVIGLDYNRIQFTSDLMPADVIGTSVFESRTGEFRFHQGAVFTQLLLADELNRATPKSQSALLEAMEERQVSIEGKSVALPAPFFVIATQNPQSQTGTFPLPESQLDRFLMRFSLGYPNPKAEINLLKGGHGRHRLSSIKQTLSTETLREWQKLASNMHCSDALIDYVHRLVAASRQHNDCQLGLSPRGGLALIRSAQAWATLAGRDHVLPEDVQAVFVPVAGHRLVGRQETQGDALARKLLKEVEVVSRHTVLASS